MRLSIIACPINSCCCCSFVRGAAEFVQSSRREVLRSDDSSRRPISWSDPFYKAPLRACGTHMVPVDLIIVVQGSLLPLDIKFPVPVFSDCCKTK